jgi:hypothetical protein
MKKPLIAAVVWLTLGLTSAHAELVHQFKNPTFSGQGWASQVLTVEQMRQSAQASKDSKAAGVKKPQQKRQQQILHCLDL